MSVIARRWIANLAAAMAVGVFLLLSHCNPADYHFYPRCPVHYWLHVYCPGCGGTRALAALLHGRWREALHWNPIVVMLLPFAASFFALAYARALRDRTFVWPEIPTPWLQLLLVVIAAFTLARNLVLF